MCIRDRYGAVDRASEVKDDRLAALYVAKAGQELFSNGGAGVSQFTAGNVSGQFGDLADTATGKTLSLIHI